MDEIKALFTLDYAQLILTVFIVLAGLKAITLLLEWFCKKTGLQFKWMVLREKERQILYENVEDIQALKSQREEDVKQSIKHDKEIKDDLKSLTNVVGQIDDKLNIMQVQNDATERARLKDKIGQSYRYYHEKQQWNSMEEEALRDLISQYEAHGGKNSFVHDTVEPETYTWKKV